MKVCIYIIKQFTGELETDLLEISMNEDIAVMMVGDFNAHIGNDQEGIMGNHAKIGTNGKEYREIIKRNNLVLVNNTEKCKGLWTRIEKDKKTILDFTITNEKAYERINKIEIDDDLKHTLESKRSKTDHIMTTIEYQLKQRISTQDTRTIRITNKKNWKEYKTRVEEEIRRQGNDIGKKYTVMEECIQKAGECVIKKRKIKRKRKIPMIGYNKEMKEKIKERRETFSAYVKEKEEAKEQEMKDKYIRIKEEIIQYISDTQRKELSKMISEKNNGKVDFWKIIKDIKRKPEEQEKLKNKDGIMTNNMKEILELKREYYKNLYKKAEMNNEEIIEEQKMKEEIMEQMENRKDDNMNKDFTEEEIQDAMKELKKNKAPGPDGITNEMIQEGGEVITKLMTTFFNKLLEDEEKLPASWKTGDIVSIYKGKGNKADLTNQRGLSLTSCVLKLLEKVIANRISKNIQQYSTTLQGGGKKGEATEEYLLIIQTVIDKNKKEGKNTKIIITDVKKAFDQAWRIGVIHNLSKRKINGKILRLIWNINNELKARIKWDEVTHSEEFDVEGSVRQGSGLSAILYGQHAGCTIEKCEKEKIGSKLAEQYVPAVGWQDDITMLASDDEEEKEIVKYVLQSAKENKIQFSDEKCKYLIVGKKKDNFEDTYFGEKRIEKVNKSKVLGYIFSEDGNNMEHIQQKSNEAIEMVAALGLTISNSTMSTASIRSMIILYKSCIIPKIIYGLGAFETSVKEMDMLDLLERRILKNFTNLPQCTTKVALYNEFGIIPITYKIKSKKLMMFHRMMNRTEENESIKNTINEQIRNSLPWFKQVVRIANEWNINIHEAKEMTKAQIKTKIKEKIKEKVKIKMQEDRNVATYYKEISTEDIKPGEVKDYMKLEKKLSSAICRARTNTLDPAPRKSNWDTIWKCKFCNMKTQTSQHYILECYYTGHIFGNSEERKNSWELLQCLNGTDKEIEILANKVKVLYKLLQEQE